MSRSLACAVALTTALAAAPAAAAPARTAALLSVRLLGSFTPRERTELPPLIRKALAGAGLTVFDPEQLELAFGNRPRDDWSGCPDDRCRVAIARSLGAQRLVDAVIKRDRAFTTVTLLVFNAETSQPAGEALRTCPGRCDPAALRRTFTDAAKGVVADDRDVAWGRLVVRTIPGGATISVDGRALAETDADLPLAAGPHTVVLERSGYPRVESKVTVAANATAKIELALGAVGLPSKEPGAGSGAGGVEPRAGGGRLRTWAYAVLGAGAVALLAGGVLYGVGCDPVAGARHCPQKPIVRTSGTALLVTGGVLAAGGAGLWVYDWRRERARVALGPGGLTLALDWQ